MVGQNGYFVNPEAADRTARAGRNGQNGRRELPDGLEVGEWPCLHPGRVRKAHQASGGIR